jgi:hypothetical protein
MMIVIFDQKISVLKVLLVVVEVALQAGIGGVREARAIIETNKRNHRLLKIINLNYIKAF